MDLNSSLNKASLDIFYQLTEVLQQIPDTLYSVPLPLLSDSTMGKHVRHILAFYECVCEGAVSGNVNYDARSRCLQLETDRAFCISRLHHMAAIVHSIDTNKKMSVQVSVSIGEKPVSMESSLVRELAYALEHAIHHMAILKMAIISVNCSLQLPPNFGVAFSTTHYQGKYT